MTISELIKELEDMRAEHGNVEVRLYDSYEANEGWGESEVWSDDFGIFYCEDESLDAHDNSNTAPRASFVGLSL